MAEMDRTPPRAALGLLTQDVMARDAQRLGARGAEGKAARATAREDSRELIVCAGVV